MFQVRLILVLKPSRCGKFNKSTWLSYNCYAGSNLSRETPRITQKRMNKPGIEPETSRTRDECSTTELLVPQWYSREACSIYNSSKRFWAHLMTKRFAKQRWSNSQNFTLKASTVDVVYMSWLFCHDRGLCVIMSIYVLAVGQFCFNFLLKTFRITVRDWYHWFRKGSNHRY